MIRTESTSRGSSLRRRLGLSVSAIVLLAAIAAIRVPLHDLGLVQKSSAAAWLLVFLPLAVWVGVALQRQVPNPLLTLTVVGFAYAVMLAGVHQLFWGAAFGDDMPSLGGNLEGVLAPGVEAAVFRVSAFFSSLVTGTMVGALTGAVTWAIARLRRT
jgi:hypothetical protein